MKTTQARVPAELHERVQALAKGCFKSNLFIYNSLLGRSLEQLEDDSREAREAVAKVFNAEEASNAEGDGPA